MELVRPQMEMSCNDDTFSSQPKSLAYGICDTKPSTSDTSKFIWLDCAKSLEAGLEEDFRGLRGIKPLRFY